MAELIILKNDYDTITALKNVFNYVSDMQKSNGLVGAHKVILDQCFNEALAVNRYFYDNTIKRVIHFIIAFAPDECILPQDAFNEAYRICALLPEYQIVFGVHPNTDNLHIHFAMNPVSLVNGHKFYFDKTNLINFLNGVREILKPYKIKIYFQHSERKTDFMFSEQLNCTV